MTNTALELLRQKLQDKLKEITVLSGELNAIEKTVSRLRNELKEEYDKIDETLDKG